MRDILKFSEPHLAQMCCSPMTLVSVGLSVVGGMMEQKAIQAQTAAQQAQVQAQINASRYNQEVAQQNAEIVRGQTEAELDKADRERRLRLGANRAGAGASGVGAESFGDTLRSSAMQEELDLLTIQSEGLLRERSFLNTAGLEANQQAGLQQQIPLIGKAGQMKSAAAIVSGTSKAIGML